MKVEIFYFADCPHHQPALERVKEVLQQEGVVPDILEVEVPDAETALRLQFLGSPSIRVNGVDIEPSARSAKDFGLMCRTYGDGCCHSGLPSRDMIRSAIRHMATAPSAG